MNFYPVSQTFLKETPLLETMQENLRQLILTNYGLASEYVLASKNIKCLLDDRSMIFTELALWALLPHIVHVYCCNKAVQ